MKKLTLDELQERLRNLNYAFFDGNKPYNINIIAVRSKNRIANAFDDHFHLCYRDRMLRMHHFIFHGTTDPGENHLFAPLSSKGTAIVVPGQYRGIWGLGLHAGKYRALVQVKPIKVYRDNNRDNILNLDPKTIEEGMFGINLHRASEWRNLKDVGLYSAGCQVIQSAKDFELIIKACEISLMEYGNNFTFTLIDEL